MPNGPGAPSDVGPDGGLMDPGMVGPDGMPMDPGMDPGMEDEGAPPPDDAGGNPFGGDDGGDGADEGTPPPSKDKDSGSGSDKKPPKSKKKSARTYRGLGGQVLTEDQFTRHLAVSLSGYHPAVMAAVRKTADEGRGMYTPHVREVLPLHMMSHHGWSPAEVRSAMQWPPEAYALERHHDSEHAQYADPPMQHRIPHAHEDVSYSPDDPEWKPSQTSGADTDWLRQNGITGSRRPARRTP